MKSRFLFPHYCRLIGYLCFVIDILKAIILKLLHPQGFTQTGDVPNIWMNITNDFNIIIVIIGLLLIAFSREKDEDELISQLRLDSLQWAIYVNYCLFLILVVLIHGFKFLEIVAYNVITPLIFFIIRFRWKVFLLNRNLAKESN
ncbi:hypothetical protein [Mucilaginibacter kameinonensis]|uniref:hypothetical protein n=1 Tax=Mucilaginibacter kameinonensis TaxID=452286 RepID=UPI000EF79FB7|nr:hypothetical protein [Mucilaginibacter kameinonensis]